MGEIQKVSTILVHNYRDKLVIKNGGTISLSFANGSIGTLTVYWWVTYHNDGEKIICNKGVVEINGVERQTIRQSPLGVYDYGSSSREFPCIEWNWEKSFTNLISHFVDCIRGKEKPLVIAEEGRATIRVIEAIYESSLKKREVEIELC